MTEARHLRRPTLWHYLACYGLYAVLLVLCYAAFWILRSTIEVLLSYALRRSPAFEWVYLSTSLLVGLALFAVVIAGEAYLRTGVRRGSLSRLVSRFARLAVPLALVVGLGMVVQELIYRRAGL